MLRLKGKDRSRRGQMPLALVAVVLLVTGSFFGVVYADIERATDNSEHMADELTSLDREAERAEFDIESGIGMIISDLSASDGGNLVDRAEAFNGMVRDYFRESYPRFERGVNTDILDSDISLGLETYRSDSDDFFTGGGCASFLRASGTVTVSFATESASSVRELPIEADATSGLPLVIEASTGFELSGEGEISALTQMMEYQLSSMAQYRIMQGFGMYNGSGVGTDDIITAEDVEDAFRNAVSVLQTMFFRDNGSGSDELVRACQVDIAELFTAQDGYLRINIGSLFSQALLSGLDSYVVKWIDYLRLDKVLDIADSISDSLGRFWRGFVELVTGKDADVSVIKEHIRNQVDALGLSQDGLLRPFSGETLTVTVPSYTFTVDADSDTAEYTVEEKTVTVDLPDVDITGWNGWNGFMDRYEEERNNFREAIRAIITEVAYNIEDKMVYLVPVDVFDGRSFYEDYAETAESLLDYGDDRIDGCLAETVRMNRISDPLMIAVYKDVRDNRDDVYGAGTFSENLRKKVFDETYGADSPVLSGIPQDQMDAYRLMVEQQVVVPAEEEFSERVGDKLDEFRVITTAKDANSSRITEIIARSASGLMEILNLRTVVGDLIRDVYGEMLDYSCISPFDGPVELPSECTFHLMDENGNRYDEKLAVTDSIDLRTEIVTPTERTDNQHMTAALETHHAAYVSYFTVSIDARVEYTVRSANPVYQALGLYDAVHDGSFDVSAELTIPCLSAWALEGTSYQDTNTLIGDVWQGILDLLDPIIQPLKKTFKSMQTASRVVSASVTEFTNYLGKMVRDLYDTLMAPLDLWWSITSGAIAEMLSHIGVVGVDLTGQGQTMTFDVFGVTLTVHLNLRSLSKQTKELCTLTLSKEFDSGLGISVSVKLKKDAESVYPLITAGADGGDWNVRITADPLQKQGDRFLSIAGKTRTVEYSGTMPELVQYRQFGFSLSDVPAVGTAISNIPLPIPGVKGSIDAGLELKYDVPAEPGILINEVEANPAGNDRGCEWVEILNNTRESVDLEGYWLYPVSGRNKGVEITDTVLGPGQRAVVTFPGMALNNSKESVILEDADGDRVDESPEFTDGENSDFTWQRIFDGSTVWKSLPGTPDVRNGGGMTDRFGIGPMLFDIVTESALDVLDEMGGRINTVDGLCEYLRNVVSRIIDTVIEMIGGCIIEACVFLEVELTDYTGSGHAGFRLGLGFDGELIEDGIRYLLSMVPILGEYVNNPEGMTAEKVLYQDIYLRTVFYTGVSMPAFLGGLADTEQDLGLSVRTNLSGITEMMGEGIGRWSADAGLVAENVPSGLLPPVFDADPSKMSDLWLIDMHFEQAEA